MVNAWFGGRRVAFIPVSNSQVDATLPGSFEAQVERRAFYDPDANGMDRSLQRYIQTISSGRAHIDGRVFPAVAAPDEDVISVGLLSLPQNHGFDFAVMILPHSMGPHRSGFAWMDNPKINGVGSYGRVALFNDESLTQRQNIGVWAMETLHAVTWFGDLYNVSPQLGRYDVMACSCGTHPTTHTKSEMGWIHSGAIGSHAVGTRTNYELHAVSNPQPPPPGRVTAVRIKSKMSAGHFMIEARLRNDPYESPGSLSSGIPEEGLLVYQVQGTTDVFRLAVIGPGETFELDREDLSIRVTGTIPGGLRVAVDARVSTAEQCNRLHAKIEGLKTSLELETDINVRKQLISALQNALADFRSLNCLIAPEPADLALAFRPQPEELPSSQPETLPAQEAVRE